MGSNINFSNFIGDSSGSNNNQSKPLARQSSLYSLTFDELQTTLGEPGKDFGSMNMDELLMTAEETQAIMTTTSSSVAAIVPGGSVLQRQGSLTLPRTLSQKTVDEVWKHLISKEGSNVSETERQQALGEMTLEDFLLRAGVVKEDNENNSGFFANNNSAAAFDNQPNQNRISFSGNNNDSMILNQAAGLGVKVSGTMQQQQSHQRLPPTIFPKQTNVTFAAVIGGAGVTVATSPGTSRSSAENNTWSSSVPYVFGRGRRSNTGVVEKVVERRQKRMIKNRESAARSRARKQAYTLELEAEIENLKQLNKDLQKKQSEIMKTQKHELKDSSKLRPWLAKSQCLRRTLTGPW